MSVRDEPINTVERACQAAFDAVDQTLAESGAKVVTLYVALHAEGVPKGELDAVGAAHGELPDDPRERSRDVVAFLVSEAVQVGQQIGIDVKIMPLHGGALS